MTVLESAFYVGIASAHLETYLIVNNIYSFEKEDDNGPMKSMP